VEEDGDEEPDGDGDAGEDGSEAPCLPVERLDVAAPRVALVAPAQEEPLLARQRRELPVPGQADEPEDPGDEHRRERDREGIQVHRSLPVPSPMSESPRIGTAAIRKVAAWRR
jgi:hypothetical protein